VEVVAVGLHHSPDGITNPKYKLFQNNLKFFCKEKNALAFNQDRCCHLALCLLLIPFCWFQTKFLFPPNKSCPDIVMHILLYP